MRQRLRTMTAIVPRLEAILQRWGITFDGETFTEQVLSEDEAALLRRTDTLHEV